MEPPFAHNQSFSLFYEILCDLVSSGVVWAVRFRADLLFFFGSTPCRQQRLSGQRPAKFRMLSAASENSVVASFLKR